MPIQIIRLKRCWNGLLMNEQKVGVDGWVTGVDSIHWIPLRLL